MKFTSISDVHIRRPDDERVAIFCRFMELSMDRDVDYIFLLGDIFDLMVGGHDYNLEKYHHVFAVLEKALASSINIRFIEGNHDFHISTWLNERFGGNGKFIATMEPQILQDGDRKILLCHGDEKDLHNNFYNFYRCMIKSRLVSMLANDLVPGRFIDHIGKSASKSSRKRNLAKYGLVNNPEIQKRQRSNIAFINRHYQCDLVLSGHSHSKDIWTSDEGWLYANSGYAPSERKALCYAGDEISFMNLD